MSEPKWLEISTVEDMKNKQQRIMHETTGEVRLIPPDELPDGLGPDAAPPPGVEQRGATMAHEWIQSDWPDDPEPMCKWCRLSRITIGDDDCVGPSVEQMIEAMGGVTVFRIGDHWVACPDELLEYVSRSDVVAAEGTGTIAVAFAESPGAAIAALYAAWRERADGEG